MSNTYQTNGRRHPLLAMEDEIARHGIVVIEGVTRLPTYNKPFSSPHMIISINHGGSVVGDYDTLPIRYGTHDIAVIFPNHILLPRESSADHRTTLVVVSGTFHEQLRKRTTYRHQLDYSQDPIFHLDEEQYAAMLHLIGLFKAASRLEETVRAELSAKIFEVLARMLGEYRFANDNHQQNRYESLFARFHDAIAKHYTESREVKFYADLLCLSPKYFGTIIKQQTGISARQWIANYVVIQAKSMLAHNRHMPVQQVSKQLGFPDQATFARYFKANTSLTPKEFREQ